VLWEANICRVENMKFQSKLSGFFHGAKYSCKYR
jgi:hypothetical protein